MSGDGVDDAGRMSLSRTRRSEAGCERGGQADGVDVVAGDGFAGGDGKAGPDDGGAIDGWNEKGESVGVEIVYKRAIGQLAARKIVKVTTLAIESASFHDFALEIHGLTEKVLLDRSLQSFESFGLRGRSFRRERLLVPEDIWPPFWRVLLLDIFGVISSPLVYLSISPC